MEKGIREMEFLASSFLYVRQVIVSWSSQGLKLYLEKARKIQLLNPIKFLVV